MDIHGVGAGVEEHEVLLNLADAANGRLEDLLDEYALLWVHHLVIALLELSIDLNVLHIERSQVLEHLILGPGVDMFDTGVVLLRREVLHFDLRGVRGELILPALASHLWRLAAANRTP